MSGRGRGCCVKPIRINGAATATTALSCDAPNYGCVGPALHRYRELFGGTERNSNYAGSNRDRDFGTRRCAGAPPQARSLLCLALPQAAFSWCLAAVHIWGLIVDESWTESNGRSRNLKHKCRNQAFSPLCAICSPKSGSVSAMGCFELSDYHDSCRESYADRRFPQRTSIVRIFAWPRNTSSAEITESRVSVPYAKSAVANTVLTASARSAADVQANTTAAVSALGVKRPEGCTTVTVPAPYARCVASA